MVGCRANLSCPESKQSVADGKQIARLQTNIATTLSLVSGAQQASLAILTVSCDACECSLHEVCHADQAAQPCIGACPAASSSLQVGTFNTCYNARQKSLINMSHLLRCAPTGMLPDEPELTLTCRASLVTSSIPPFCSYNTFDM